jgi:hypothetical protein
VETSPQNLTVDLQSISERTEAAVRSRLFLAFTVKVQVSLGDDILIQGPLLVRPLQARIRGFLEPVLGVAPHPNYEATGDSYEHRCIIPISEQHLGPAGRDFSRRIDWTETFANFRSHATERLGLFRLGGRRLTESTIHIDEIMHPELSFANDWKSLMFRFGVAIDFLEESSSNLLHLQMTHS